MTARRVAIVMSDVHMVATGKALRPEDAADYLRNPKTFCHLIESSGVLEDPVRRTALEKLIQEEVSDGV